MASLTEVSDSVVPEPPVIHNPIVRKKRSLLPASVAQEVDTSKEDSSFRPTIGKKEDCAGKKHKHQMPPSATHEYDLGKEVEIVCQEMAEAGKSFRIRRQLWYPVQQLMQKIALDTYFKVDKFYREKEGRDPVQRSTQDIFQELKAAGQLSLIPRADLQEMERLVERIGYEAFVEIERQYCEMEEYEGDECSVDN